MARRKTSRRVSETRSEGLDECVCQASALFPLPACPLPLLCTLPSPLFWFFQSSPRAGCTDQGHQSEQVRGEDGRPEIAQGALRRLQQLRGRLSVVRRSPMVAGCVVTASRGGVIAVVAQNTREEGAGMQRSVRERSKFNEEHRRRREEEEKSKTSVHSSKLMGPYHEHSLAVFMFFLIPAPSITDSGRQYSSIKASESPLNSLPPPMARLSFVAPTSMFETPGVARMCVTLAVSPSPPMEVVAVVNTRTEL